VGENTRLSLPVGDHGAMLVITYSDDEVSRASHRRAMLTLVVLLAAFFTTLVSASIGFRLIVGRRLAKLHAALRMSATPGQRAFVNPGRYDELSEIIRAYNSLMKSEQEREAALTEKNQRLDDASRRDPMTGLYNRRHFEEWVSDFNGETVLRQLTGVIGLIDVDYFKSINDTYGHGVGDEVLVTLAKRLSNAMRTGDFLVRWGGEEILIYVAEHQNIEAIARRVLTAATGKPVSTAVGELQITASMGLARLPLSAGDFFLSIDRAITLADSALYMAKATGRNRAICIHAVHVQSPVELEDLEGDLKRASENHLVHLGTVIPDERTARKQGTVAAAPV
jgi:diguanylate cyclase (GGDEF)-like protein